MNLCNILQQNSVYQNIVIDMILFVLIEGFSWCRLPIGIINSNLPADGKIPDVEFQKNGENWVLDVKFTKPHNEEESFASKTDKY